jgi:hypothetical protein
MKGKPVERTCIRYKEPWRGSIPWKSPAGDPPSLSDPAHQEIAGSLS